MAEVNCKLKVSFVPENPQPGMNVEVTAEVLETTAPLDHVVGTVEFYGLRTTLAKREENLFGASIFVPYEAPPGRYTIAFWGVTASGEKGPREEVTVTLRP